MTADHCRGTPPESRRDSRRDGLTQFMKSSIILYAAASALTPEHVPFPVSGGYGFLRVEERPGLSYAEALDVAKPLTGEVVLNSIAHPQEERLAGVFARLQTILVEQLGIEPADVKAAAPFYGRGPSDDGTLGCDSLDTVELVMAAEEEFDIDIPDEDAERLQTVGEAVLYIAQALHAKETKKLQAA
jgi:acyl carrier protein